MNLKKKKLISYMLMEKTKKNNFDEIFCLFSYKNNNTSSFPKNIQNIPLPFVKYINMISINETIYPFYTKSGVYIIKLLNRTINNKIDVDNLYIFNFFYKSNYFLFIYTLKSIFGL